MLNELVEATLIESESLVKHVGEVALDVALLDCDGPSRQTPVGEDHGCIHNDDGLGRESGILTHQLPLHDNDEIGVGTRGVQLLTHGIIGVDNFETGISLLNLVDQIQEILIPILQDSESSTHKAIGINAKACLMNGHKNHQYFRIKRQSFPQYII